MFDKLEEAIKFASKRIIKNSEYINAGSSKYCKGDRLIGKEDGLFPGIKILILEVINHSYIYLMSGYPDPVVDFDKWIEDNYKMER